ncbi:uncharacterized protein BP01DRAFT_75307 [Aspergillus saccharolyticus JOP 1030-1]|uniref:DUF7053 domain-containing protein n=1 Tax=Aspergillus saccharolyticus JOP 1030-1 TaxID=1450539 RepID=A0A319ASR3_9EURO|nr:hypothetical protein BP01DRAFT_75307 [Aspergillus saccharolyticus JOP 1030-1]PYH49292.1 hypothetical protein BP01DRAFT_75307 [Aspergillus saccharolyticus JOP 1030-1]
MVHAKLLTGLLVVACLLSIPWRISNHRTVTTGIPPSANPDTIRQLLHDHPFFIQLNPLITGLSIVPTAPERYEDEWLLPTAEEKEEEGGTSPIHTYLLSQAIPMLPGASGGWGQKHIQFETWLRNTPTGGVKTRADAPFGVSVASHWAVEPTASFSGRQDSPDWRITVQRRITCVWWMTPFVAYTYDKVHASIMRDLIQLAS